MARLWCSQIVFGCRRSRNQTCIAKYDIHSELRAHTLDVEDKLVRHQSILEGVSYLAQNFLSRFYHPGFPSRLETVSVASSEYSDYWASQDDSKASSIDMIQKILKSNEGNEKLESALDQCSVVMNEEIAVEILRRNRSDWKLALSFFNWVATKPGYSHGLGTYNEMLDILGRMKMIKLMRQLFEDIPKGRGGGSIINDKTFAILLNRYAGAHKVQEAIELFYKRKDYGLELDLAAFQMLLLSLCRYKHVEEAEDLFWEKQDEFPPDIKSRNIILNGWCILGSLHDAKRFWKEIMSSKCEPDLFTYSIFINSLTKSGKLGTAMKLFASMPSRGVIPDVTIYNCMIDALCFKQKIPRALKIFGEMNGHGCAPNVVTYNSLIKHLCKIKRMEKVDQLLADMEEKGCSPNTITYSYILKKAKKPEDVNVLLRRMEGAGCRIDSDTYNLLLSLYMEWRYLEGIHYVWTEMERRGLGPDQRSYAIMIHGLFFQEKFDEALQYYEEMKSKGFIPEPRTGILIKAIHLRRNEGSRAFESSLSLKRGGFKADLTRFPS